MIIRFQLNPKSKYFVGTITFILAIISMIAPFSIDAYLPAIKDIMKGLDTSLRLVELTFSAYLIGYAFGQFFGGYFADKFGRRTASMTGLCIYLLGTLGIIFAGDIYQILAFRFGQAIGGGIILVTVMAIARDLFEGRILAQRLSLITLLMLAAPLVAPILGTYLNLSFGWRSIFIFLAAFAFLLLILVFFLVPSTQTEEVTLPPIKVFRRVISHRDSMANMMTAGFIFSGMFCFIIDSNFLYVQFYEKPVELFSVLFGANVILMMLTSAINAKIVKKTGTDAIVKPALIFQFSLVIYMTSSYFFEFDNFWTTFLGIVFVIGTNGFLYGNVNANALNYFGDISASAASIMGLLRSGMGALTSAILTLIHTHTPDSMAWMMLFCNAGAIICFFWLRDRKNIAN